MESPHPHRAVSRETSDNVFAASEDHNSHSPSPSLRPPGIVLTVDAESASAVPSRRSRSGSRRMHQQQQHCAPRSPSGSRCAVGRSQSVRTARRPQSRQRIASIPNELGLDHAGLGHAPSNQSLPAGDDFTRLRNFAITSKGLVNRGDSFRSKSRSAHSVAAAAEVVEQHLAPPPAAEEEVDVVEGAGAAAPEDEVEAAKNERFQVLVVGAGDVGKTALTNQFMTSEYKCAYDISQDEEKEKSVGVVLNGSESELVFSEHQYVSDSSDNFTELFGGPDAYLVVYSVTSKRSLHAAKEILRLIRKWDNPDAKAIILVGNKMDLARHRILSTDDGRSLAVEEGSKFIETSAGINHHVDDLLVGILSQIRLKRSSQQRALQKRESVSLGSPAKLKGGKCPGCAGCKAKGLLKRILKKACNRSKSCDNLHVL